MGKNNWLKKCHFFLARSTRRWRCIQECPCRSFRGYNAWYMGGAFYMIFVHHVQWKHILLPRQGVQGSYNYLILLYDLFICALLLVIFPMSIQYIVIYIPLSNKMSSLSIHKTMSIYTKTLPVHIIANTIPYKPL